MSSPLFGRHFGIELVQLTQFVDATFFWFMLGGSFYMRCDTHGPFADTTHTGTFIMYVCNIVYYMLVPQWALEIASVSCLHAFVASEQGMLELQV